MTIALSTAGFWHHASFEETLFKIAQNGVKAIEFFPYPPHLQPASFSRYERVRIGRLLRQLGLRCTSAAFSVELNLLSLHSGLHDLAMSEFRRVIEIGAELGAPYFVLAIGNRHGVLPAPLDATIDFICAEIYALADHAKRAGIKLALETLPSDFLTTGRSVMELIDRVGHPELGACYDCSNTFAHEDPAEGVKALSNKLFLVHVSDCWRNKWAHAAIGRGEIDFSAFSRALDQIGYKGDVVYELMDGENPEPRITDGVRRLTEAGFRA
jgi:sugar phosphate isomerase/epimerase